MASDVIYLSKSAAHRAPLRKAQALINKTKMNFENKIVTIKPVDSKVTLSDKVSTTLKYTIVKRQTFILRV